MVRAAQGDYQALAKLAAEEPRLTRLRVSLRCVISFRRVRREGLADDKL